MRDNSYMQAKFMALGTANLVRSQQPLEARSPQHKLTWTNMGRKRRLRFISALTLFLSSRKTQTGTVNVVHQRLQLKPSPYVKWMMLPQASTQLGKTIHTHQRLKRTSSRSAYSTHWRKRARQKRPLEHHKTRGIALLDGTVCSWAAPSSKYRRKSVCWS